MGDQLNAFFSTPPGAAVYLALVAAMVGVIVWSKPWRAWASPPPVPPDEPPCNPGEAERRCRDRCGYHWDPVAGPTSHMRLSDWDAYDCYRACLGLPPARPPLHNLARAAGWRVAAAVQRCGGSPALALAIAYLALAGVLVALGLLFAWAVP